MDLFEQSWREMDSTLGQDTETLNRASELTQRLANRKAIVQGMDRQFAKGVVAADRKSVWDVAYATAQADVSETTAAVTMLGEPFDTLTAAYSDSLISELVSFINRRRAALRVRGLAVQARLSNGWRPAAAMQKAA